MKKALVTFAGNHLGDDIRSANIFNFEADPTLGGNPYVVAASSAAGVLTAPVGWMHFTPQVEPGLGAGNNASLVVQQTPAAAGNLPIRGLPAGAPAAGYYLDFVQSFPMIRLDNPRSLLLTVVATNLAPSTAFNFYASGADIYGQLMTVSKVIPAGLVATTSYDLLKSFAYIKSMVVTAATGCPIWVGVGKTFGMDYYTPSTAFITRATYANVSLAISLPGTQFLSPPALNAAPISTGNDVRGSISIPAGTAITGVDALTVQYIIEGATAQSGWTYTPDVNLWTVTPNSTRVLHVLGAAQYYNAAQA